MIGGSWFTNWNNYLTYVGFYGLNNGFAFMWYLYLIVSCLEYNIELPTLDGQMRLFMIILYQK